MKNSFFFFLFSFCHRHFTPRPRRLLSSDGKNLLNLWFIPHFSEVHIPPKVFSKAIEPVMESSSFGVVQLPLNLIV